MTPEQSKKLIGDYLLELQREMPRLSDGMPMSEYQIQAAQEAGVKCIEIFTEALDGETLHILATLKALQDSLLESIKQERRGRDN